LFALIVKSLQANHAGFGNSEMTALLEKGNNPSRPWVKFCKGGLDLVRAAYKADAKRYRGKTGKDLTVANFSKAQEYVGKLLGRPLPRQYRQLAKRVLPR